MTKKLEIVYPSVWVYKVIGREEAGLRAAVIQVLGARECLVVPSRTSSGGKYLCLDVELVVESAEEREAAYHAFKQHPEVVLVL